jgi:hypothetical protein
MQLKSGEKAFPNLEHGYHLRTLYGMVFLGGTVPDGAGKDMMGVLFMLIREEPRSSAEA